MNNGLKYILTFSLGAAAGAAVAWQYLKKKYEQITREEIESVKEVFSQLNTSEDEANAEAEANALSKAEYEKMVQSAGYAQNTEKGGSEAMDDIIELISPDELGEYGDYDVEELTYFADGIMADRMGEVIEDVDGIVGEESLKHFGDFEENLLYVRNHMLKTDFEIAKDEQNYAELVGLAPNQAEEE